MPGNRIYQPVRGLPQDQILLSGRFTVNGSSVVTAQTPVAGQVGFTVAKKAATTGIYVITLDDTYPVITSVKVGTVRASANKEMWQVSKVTDGTSSANAVEVTYIDSATGAAGDPTTVECMVEIVATTHAE